MVCGYQTMKKLDSRNGKSLTEYLVMEKQPKDPLEKLLDDPRVKMLKNKGIGKLQLTKRICQIIPHDEQQEKANL